MQYLVTSADVLLLAIDVHAAGNVGGLLLDGDEQVKGLPIETFSITVLRFSEVLALEDLSSPETRPESISSMP